MKVKVKVKKRKRKTQQGNQCSNSHFWVLGGSSHRKFRPEGKITLKTHRNKKRGPNAAVIEPNFRHPWTSCSFLLEASARISEFLFPISLLLLFNANTCNQCFSHLMKQSPENSIFKMFFFSFFLLIERMGKKTCSDFEKSPRWYQMKNRILNASLPRSQDEIYCSSGSPRCCTISPFGTWGDEREIPVVEDLKLF
jgi:hypothetical protein